MLTLMTSIYFTMAFLLDSNITVFYTLKCFNRSKNIKEGKISDENEH